MIVIIITSNYHKTSLTGISITFNEFSCIYFNFLKGFFFLFVGSLFYVTEQATIDAILIKNIAHKKQKETFLSNQVCFLKSSWSKDMLAKVSFFKYI